MIVVVRLVIVRAYLYGYLSKDSNAIIDRHDHISLKEISEYNDLSMERYLSVLDV